MEQNSSMLAQLNDTMAELIEKCEGVKKINQLPLIATENHMPELREQNENNVNIGSVMNEDIIHDGDDIIIVANEVIV